jgi:putative membrane protein
VVVAGLYGGATANPRILFVQGVPAAIALALVRTARE